MPTNENCIVDCSEYKVNLCGKNFDYICQIQADHKKKTKRHLSVEKAIIQVITKARETQ